MKKLLLILFLVIPSVIYAGSIENQIISAVQQQQTKSGSTVEGFLNGQEAERDTGWQVVERLGAYDVKRVLTISGQDHPYVWAVQVAGDQFNISNKTYYAHNIMPPLAIEKTPPPKMGVYNSRRNIKLTASEFIDRYNRSLRTLESPVRFYIKSKDQNKKSVIYQLKANKNLAAIISVDKNTNYIEDFTFIGSGDGTTRSGVNLILTTTAIIMAFEDPDMMTTKRRQVTEDIGLLNKKVTEHRKNKFSRNGISYTVSKSKTLGIWITAEPQGRKS